MKARINWSIIAILIVLICIGTFWDFSISTALYSPDTIFGTLVVRYGNTIPILTITSFCLLSLALFRNYKHSKKDLALMVLCLTLVFALVLFVAYAYIGLYEGSNPTVVFFGHLLLVLLIETAILRFISKIPVESRATLKKLASLVLISFLIALVLVETIKQFWGRPRFYTVMDGLAQFSPWYIPHGYASSDLFKSFPSGHACAAASTFAITFLPWVNSKYERYAAFFYIASLIWLGCVMFGRVLAGAHHLSDVAFGGLFTILTYQLIVVRAHRKTD